MLHAQARPQRGGHIEAGHFIVNAYVYLHVSVCTNKCKSEFVVALNHHLRYIIP